MPATGSEKPAPISPAGPSKAPLDVAPAPALGKVAELLRQGKGSEAILVAFRSAEDDFRRAFGLQLPKQWTHRELMEKYLRRDMGYLVTLLPRLYAFYEPVRYGAPHEVTTDGLMDLLRAIYQEPSLRRLSWTIGSDSTLTSVTASRRPTASTPRPGGGSG